MSKEYSFYEYGLKFLGILLFVLFSFLSTTYAADTNAFVIRVKTDNLCAGGCDIQSFPVQASAVAPGYAVDCNYNGISFATTTSGLTTSYTCNYGTPGTYDIAIKATPAANLTYAINGSTISRYRLLEVKQWGTIKWSSFANMFYGASNMNITATDIPDLTNVTSFLYAFRDTSSMVGNATMGSWNVSNVTSMSSAFSGATLFNQNIGSWNTSKVTNFEAMFQSTNNFNQNIGSWVTASSTNFASMFNAAVAFNNGGSPSINNWNVSNATTLQGMFDGAKAFNQPIGNWNTAKVTIMNFMFRDAWLFNQDISSWDTGNVTQLRYTFNNARVFNQPIGSWNTSKVTDSNRTFAGAFVFNQDLGSWNMASNTNMSYMFQNATQFNNGGSPSIGLWNTGKVTTFQAMFNYASNFNQNIGAWNTALATNMNAMFQGATKFNNGGSSSINSWNTGNVINMNAMFEGAAAFDQPVGSWNTSKVTGMASMFGAAIKFNQDLSAWNTSLVTTMNGMFNSASLFNQNLANWTIKQVTNLGFMLNGSKLNITNYDNTLIGWEAQKPISATALGATGLKYCNATAQRSSLVSGGLAITGDSLGCAAISLLYNGNGSTAGTVPATQTGQENTTVTVSGIGSLSKTGYTFNIWNTNALGTGTNYAPGATFTFPNSTTTLYAKWTPNTYQVVFDINTGTGGSMSNQNFNYGAAQNLTANAFTKTNAVFAGWNTAANGSGTSYTNGQSVSNLTTTNGGTITLYAQWATTPVVTNVTSSTANGYYNETDVIAIDVTFDQVVNVTGFPQITLNTGAVVNYSAGTGSNTITFNYTVPAGHNTGDLDYASISALALNGGTIKNAGLVDALLTLPVPGAVNSLGANKNIVVDTVAPSAPVINVDVTGGFSLTSPNITFAATDANISHYTVSINGGATTTQSSPYNPTLGVAASYQIYVTAHDLAGNITTSSLLYPPTVNISAPTRYFNTTVTDSTITVSAPVGATLDSLSITGTTVGDITTAGMTCNVTLPGVIPAGGITCSGFVINSTTTLTAVATLSVGDGGAVGSATMYYEKNATQPSVSVTSTSSTPVSTNIFNVVISFLREMTGTNSFSSSDLSITNGTSAGACTTVDNISFSCPVNATSIGTTTVSLPANSAQDKYGNLNTVSNSFEIAYSPAATVTNVTSMATNTAYKAGDVIYLQVTLDQPSFVTGTPTLALLNGGNATYFSGSGSSTLVFAYTVTGGEDIADLDYANPNALTLTGGTIKNLYGTPALLTLPTPGTTGSLGFNKDIIIDTVAPSAPTLSSPASGSNFYSGNNFTGTCEANATVYITHPNIAPDPSSGPCDLTGNFSFPVVFNTGTTTTNIGVYQKDVAGNSSATTTLASLNVFTGPQVLSVTSPNPDNSYKTGDVVTITIEFDQTVNVTGTPELALNSGGKATYVSGTGSNTLTFTYTIGSGQNATDLDYPNINSLTLAGGTIKNPANVDANLTLPLVGIQGVLGATKNIVVDTTPPSPPTITSHTNNGYSLINTTISGTCETGATLFVTHADIVGSPVSIICSADSFSIPVTFTSLGTKGGVIIKQNDFVGNVSSNSVLTLQIVDTIPSAGGLVVPVPQYNNGTTYIQLNNSATTKTSTIFQQVSDLPDLIGGGEPGVPSEFSNYVCKRYLREYILPGEKNNPIEVKKLQEFLNENESEKLAVDGEYKQVDIEAVKRFQAKYLDQIMLPWGVKEPTGRVYRTTTAKINLMSCAKKVGCPYFKTYLKQGDESLEAVKVQDFLNIINAPVSGYPTNGIPLEKKYTRPTFENVKEFQTFYKEIVLKPWELTRATGWWYQTTRHAANKLMNCDEGEILLENGKAFR